ncbi:MAG: LysM peptidoglycan-binding domain-containing protein [Bdellovibrionaceae bacterium]|nr:LysM peptidoglycan-binding domain-containing protein [Pseudobdellovibrionaceae bacterium]
MMVRSRVHIASAIIFAAVSVRFAAAEAKTYVLKKGETLASVARSYYGEPVFGPKGSILKIYKLNAWAKTNPSLVQPGQEVILEDKENKTVQESVAAIQAVAETHAPAEAPPLPPPLVPPIEVAHAPALPPPPPAAPALPPHMPEHHLPNSYFSIIPSYSQIKQTATEDASGASYKLESSSAYGLELAWDHWWNPSFSTIFSYSGTQLKSDAVNAVSGAPVLDTTTLYRGEIIFLNRILPSLRFGFGASYGDHIFLENIGGTPVDPLIIKSSFWNPLAMAEWSAYEGEHFEVLLNAKASALPAQLTVSSRGLKNGMEYVAQFSLLQKLESVSILYGVSYSTDDQSLKAASETRTETAAKIGLLF